MKLSVKEITKMHFFKSLEMLTAFTDLCPGDIWHKKRGGFIFWQQLLHALESVHYWMRLGGDNYQAPFPKKRVFPDLEKAAVDQLSKKEITTYQQFIVNQCEIFFKNITEEKLLESSVVDKSQSNLDVILMQIRHIQYHVGHCNSILREQGVPAVPWKEAGISEV